MTETGFSAWVTGDGAAMHAAHLALVHRFMTSHLSPEQLADRDWRKRDGSDDRAIIRAAHGEVPRIQITEIRGRAESHESFSSRVAARRRQRAEGLASAAD